VKLCNEIGGLFAFDTSLSLVLKSELSNITINRSAIDQILINLVSNAIKYNDKNEVIIELGVMEAEDVYEFYVKDNGPGMEKEHQSKIFQIFQTLGTKDKFGKAGNGIGLATVKKIVDKMGGVIRVDSNTSSGSTFIFSLKKEYEPNSKRTFPCTM
jgi:signal transduction histidine kinase